MRCFSHLYVPEPLPVLWRGIRDIDLGQTSSHRTGIVVSDTIQPRWARGAGGARRLALASARRDAAQPRPGPERGGHGKPTPQARRKGAVRASPERHASAAPQPGTVTHVARVRLAGVSLVLGWQSADAYRAATTRSLPTRRAWRGMDLTAGG